MKIIKWILICLSLIISLLYIFKLDYLLRGVRTIYLTGNVTAFISDYKYFNNEQIKTQKSEYWPKHKKYNQIEETEVLKKLNIERETKAFIVIKNDSILFEKYFDNYNNNSLSNSFSVTKSIIVSMLGKAIMEGYIKGLDQPVSDFFKEYSDGLAAELTVGHLASMSSGMEWDEKYYSVINITSESYFTRDLRSLILHQKIIKKPGQSFRYSSGDTQLLGMVIEKATGVSLSSYLSEKFWIPMGAENTALWQIDSKKNKMEKAYCCISGSARDFARFGKLYINDGKWNGKKILDSKFVKQAISPVFDNSDYYGYGWWIYNFDGKKVFTMNGHRGQFVISFPKENVIIVRQGEYNEDGDVNNQEGDLYKYISEGYKLATSQN